MSSRLTSREIAVSINGGEPQRVESFDVHQERIDVSTATASKPDMEWTFVDSAGHFHAYDHEGKLPTIVRREEFIRYEVDLEGGGDREVDWEDEPDGYEVTHIECGLCGETIEPKRLPDNPHKTIPGRIEYRLTVRGAVPDGRFSVLFTVRDKTFFGFGQSMSANWAAVTYEPTHEVVCGPLSWRPAPKPPEPEPVDVWAGLRERTPTTPPEAALLLPNPPDSDLETPDCTCQHQTAVRSRT